MPVDEKKLIDLLTDFKDEIIQSMDHKVGIVQEDFQHKLDLLVEGQQSLSERLDRLDGRLEGAESCLNRVEIRGTAVEKKIDGVAADLTAHRADTEAHSKGWRVRED